MKLNSEEMRGLSDFLSKMILDKNLLQKQAKREDISLAIYAIIAEDMKLEDRLNEEVKDIMERYDSELKSGKLDYNKLFNMIKQQLIKERKLII
ncbi:MAG: DUF507 family protein [Deltaproteobacteria bacterium]|nr:DUF507 family protein [Deltaproteobacteria bacterium]